MPRLPVTLFQRDQKLVGSPHADKARRAQRVAITNDRDCFVGRGVARSAAHHHTRPVGRRRKHPQRHTRLRGTAADGVRSPHRYRERLHGVPVGVDRPVDLRVPREDERLERAADQPRRRLGKKVLN